MTLQQIRYFLILAEELHFWRTAERVYLSQSALSRQIQALEEELDVRLLERNKRNVKLTEAGKFLKKNWEHLIDEFDRTHLHAKKLSQGTSGGVSMAYPGSIAYNFLPELLAALSVRMPELHVELLEPNDESHEKLLLNYQVDIAFSRDTIQNAAIKSAQLYSEKLCVVVAKSHRLAQRSEISINEIKEEKFILSGLHHTTFYASLLRSIFSEHHFEPDIQIASDFGGVILNLVARGLGISILPYSFKKAADLGVCFIDFPEDITLYLYMNWRKNDKNPALQRIIAAATELGDQFSHALP